MKITLACITLILALFSCSGGKKQKTTSDPHKATPKIPKPATLKVLPRFGTVPKTLQGQFENLASALKKLKGSVTLSSFIDAQIPGFSKIKGNDFSEGKVTVRVLEVRRKKQLYALFLELKPDLKEADNKKDEEEECDAACKKERDEEMKTFKDGEGEGEDGENAKEEPEPGEVYLLYPKKLTAGPMVIGTSFIKECTIFNDPSPKVTFSPYFKETGTFMVTYEDNSADEDGDNADHRSVEGGTTTLLYSLDHTTVKEQWAVTDGSTDEVPGLSKSEHSALSWRKGKTTNAIYLIIKNVTVKQQYNTGDDLDAPPLWTCSTEYLVTAIPLSGHTWKELKPKEVDTLRVHEPAIGTLPKNESIIKKDAKEMPKACTH